MKGLLKVFTKTFLAVLLALSFIFISPVATLDAYASNILFGTYTDSAEPGIKGNVSNPSYIEIPGIFWHYQMIEAGTHKEANEYLQYMCQKGLGTYNANSPSGTFIYLGYNWRIHSNCSSLFSCYDGARIQKVIESWIGVNNEYSGYGYVDEASIFDNMVTMFYNRGLIANSTYVEYLSHNPHNSEWNSGSRFLYFTWASGIIFEERVYDGGDNGGYFVNGYEVVPMGKYVGNNIWSKPYSSKSAFQNACADRAASSGSLAWHYLTWKTGVENLMLGMAFNKSGVSSIVSTYSGFGAGWLFVNSIPATSGGYYYGRGFWGGIEDCSPEGDPPIPGGGGEPIVIEAKYEVKGIPDVGVTCLSDGVLENAHFQVFAEADVAEISKVKNIGGNWTVTVTENYESLGDGKYVVYGRVPGNELETHPNIVGTSKVNSKVPLKHTFTMEAAGIISWLKGEWYPHYLYNVKEGDDPEKLEYCIGFTVKAVSKTNSNWVINFTPTDIPYCEEDHPYGIGYGAGHALWTDTPASEDFPWEFHTEKNAKTYAEVVGNQVGYQGSINANGNITEDQYAQDWNVASGIPSTENLSVAIGGQTYLMDVAGMVRYKGTNGSSSLYQNSGSGSPNNAAALTRTITFDVDVVNAWMNNSLCNLSCGGHSIGTVEDSIEESSCGATSRACKVCGTTVTPTCNSNDKGKCDKNHTVSHSCSASVTFNCSTGAVTMNNCSGPSSGTLISTGQRYKLNSGTWSCPGGATISGGYDNSALLCQGYTSGTGCVASHNTNCVHPISKNHKFYIKESIDMYAYRTITNAKVYGLTDAEITAVNTELVDTNAVGQSTSNSNLALWLWRADGGYKNGNGRVWFTQFSNPNYNGGWLSTSISNSDHTTNAGYWLGDVTVKITVTADSLAADTGTPSALDAAPALSTNRGQSQNICFVTPTGNTGTQYKSNNGDAMTDGQILNLALHCVNAWQYANQSGGNYYKANIISDSLCAGVSNGISNSGSTFQNFSADIYSVDNGVLLFNYGFASSGQTYYRNHISSYSAESLGNMYRGNAFSLKDINEFSNSVARCGYLGMPSANPIEKYVTGSLPGGNVNTHGAYIRSKNDTFVQSLYNTCKGLSINPSNLGQGGAGGALLFMNASNATDTGAPYANYVDASFTGKTSQKKEMAGVTVVDMITEGTSVPKTFTGYYNTYNYPYIGSYDIRVRQNYEDKTLFTKSVTNNGYLNANSPYTYNGVTNNYNCALVISNIDMKDNAKNGPYNSPVTVKVNYRKMFDLSTADASTPLVTERAQTSYNAQYSDAYKNYQGVGGVVNDVVIHNPISMEYCGIIGNGYGSYDVNVKDETNEDMRVDYIGKSETEKPNYIVVGNSFHLWVSDFGDFYDSKGSYNDTSATNNIGVGKTGSAASIEDGKVLSGQYGYMDNMITTQWIKQRLVKFEFPVSFQRAVKDTNDSDRDGQTSDYVFVTETAPEGQLIDLAYVKCISQAGYSGYYAPDANGNLKYYTVNGPGGVSMAHKPSDTLQNSRSDDELFKYGLDFEFNIITSAVESRSSSVMLYAVAKNAPASETIDNMTTFEKNNRNRSFYTAPHIVYATYEVEVVGRIGNLALEDVGDFRYSNLFKKATDSWKIDGVIHNVNEDEPNLIYATNKDIFSDNAIINKHNTLSVTSMNKGSNYYLGKAGDFKTLPLKASDNNVEEFRKEQMRMGYNAYFDIETIGNYYGINYDEVTGLLDAGPTSATDTVEDKRINTMIITPMYYLYDYEHNELIDINLYSGHQGAYELFWSKGLSITKPISSLYTNLPTEYVRRNCTDAEKVLTEYWSTNMELNKMPTAFDGEDYIGTAERIVLDQYNRNYIGSSYLRGSIYHDGINAGVSGIKLNPDGKAQQLFTGNYNINRDNYTGLYFDGLEEKKFLKQSQRWYFTLGLPSSTCITYYGAGDNQLDIESSHNKLKAEHPNSILVVFADISITGDIWKLQYNASSVNGTTKIKLFEGTDENGNIVEYLPDGWKNTWRKEFDVLDFEDKGLKKEWAPLLFMDPWFTSADDWDTYGTH